MKRLFALFLVPAFAVALASCSSGGEGEASSEPSLAPSPSAPGTTSESGSSQKPGLASGLVGQWGGAAVDSPVLWFNASGTFNGNDGCNTLLGGWEQTSDQIELKNVSMTLMACEGVDNWISKATTVQVQGDNLLLRDANGDELGSLPRTKVAG